MIRSDFVPYNVENLNWKGFSTVRPPLGRVSR